MRTLMIDQKIIQDDSNCYVIAEIGHNHQGSLQMTKELFRAAKECGADAVKLQKRDNPSLYTSAMLHSAYEHSNSFGSTYGEHREALEFGREEYVELQQYAREIGITFFATAFDISSADFLAELDMPAFKIASGDLLNTPLLKHVAAFQKPMIVSTGGATMEDVVRAYNTIMPINSQLAILQCTSGYPSAFEELNLNVIATYRERFPDIPIGLSAHDNGIAMALVGYVQGARIIEKHFTLDRSMKGTDHAFSIERQGLQKMVRDLHRTKSALGDGVKKPYPSERGPLRKMGKQLVARYEIPAGHILRESDVAIKSPCDGLPPCELERVLGKTTTRALGVDEAITEQVLTTAPSILAGADVREEIA